MSGMAAELAGPNLTWISMSDMADELAGPNLTWISMSDGLRGDELSSGCG